MDKDKVKWIGLGVGGALVVVVLVAIVGMFFIPARRVGQLHWCEDNLKKIAVSLEMYFVDFEDYPESLEGLVTPMNKLGGTYMKELPVCPTCGKPYIYTKLSDGFELSCGKENCHFATGEVSAGYFPKYIFDKGIVKSDGAVSVVGREGDKDGSDEEPEELRSCEEAREAIDALLAVASVLKIGVTYVEYPDRMKDAKIAVDKFLRGNSGVRPELRKNIDLSMKAYEEAYLWWGREIDDPGVPPYTGYVPSHDFMFEETVSIFPDMPEMLEGNDFTKVINVGEKYSIEGVRQILWFYGEKYGNEADRIYRDNYR